jgi:hypothetical protein
MSHHPFTHWKLQPLLAGGSVLTALVLLVDLHGGLPLQNPGHRCQRIVQAKATLSRQQLAKLLTIPERAKKNQVQAIVPEPYCELPSLELRAGASAERNAYPLAFDPQTWVVILYEGDEYAGYRISSR